jgi:hypothetical protein
MFDCMGLIMSTSKDSGESVMNSQDFSTVKIKFFTTSLLRASTAFLLGTFAATQTIHSKSAELILDNLEPLSRHIR